MRGQIRNGPLSANLWIFGIAQTSNVHEIRTHPILDCLNRGFCPLTATHTDNDLAELP